MSKIVNVNKAFTEEARRRMLDEYFAAYDRLVDADLEGRDDEEATNAVSRLWDEYLAGLPIVEISRNPFTGEVFSHTIDIFGLDGLWWNADNPTRPMEPLSETTVAFTGAVSLTDPIEKVPFVCKPGPGVPFVVPRILNQQGVKAVISSCSIGNHKGYAVVYFAESEPDTLEGMGDWGRSVAFYDLGDEDFGWQEWRPAPGDFDYDLRSWQKKGKLVWIAPGDEALAIRSEENCPYIGLNGNRFSQVVSEGSVWKDNLYDEVGDAEEFEADEGFAPGQGVEPVEPSPEAPPATEPPVSAPPIQQTKFCRQCGAQLKPSAKFCPKCGTPTAK